MSTAIANRQGSELANVGSQFVDLPDAQVVAMFLRGRTANTLRKYSTDLRMFFDWLDGRSYRDVTLPDLQCWVDTLTGAPKTVRERIATVRSFYSWSTKLGILRLDPAALLQVPKDKDTLHERILPREAFAAMIAAASEGRDRVMLEFLFQSGCRVSELVLLKVKNVRLQQDGSCAVDIYRPKTNETTTQRYRPASKIPALLASLVAGRSAEDYVFRSTGVPATITATAGKNAEGQLSASAVWRIVRAAARRAGISVPASAHWYRHGCATNLVERERNLQKVAQWLGHKSIQTTMRYSHIVGDLDLSHHFDS